MIIPVILSFIFAAFIPFLFKLNRKIGKFAVPVVPAALFVYFAGYLPSVQSGEYLFESYPVISLLDINLSFYLDGLALLFVLIITGIGTVVFVYAGGYLAESKNLSKFYVYITLFMSSMLGLVLSDDLITLFVFWELTSITSYLLIGFYHSKEESRYSALQALLITGGGGLALLAGLIMLQIAGGSYSIIDLIGQHKEILSHSLYPAIVVTVLLGAFTKSAQFPFHFWLPNAMAAPAPVSAYLHSATMVKAGIYLLARITPVLGGAPIWNHTIIAFGAATMVFAAALAYKQSDLKKLLAYSTVSVLGTLTMLIGIDSDMAVKAFLIFLIAHALYKATLFMAAGSIDHETGTRDVNKLSGLRKLMPFTAALAILASLSKMGIIPLMGFVGKETVYSALLDYPNYGVFLVTAAIAANAGIVAITILVGFKPFFGKHLSTPKHAHEAPYSMWIGPMVLAFLGLLFGIIPQTLIGGIINQASTGIILEELGLKIKLWHGFNIVLLLSLITVALGLAAYFARKRISEILDNFRFIDFVKPTRIYDKALSGFLKGALFQTKILQNGYLRNYILIIVLVTVGLGGYALFSLNGFERIPIELDVTFYEIVISLIIILSTVLVMKTTSRLVAVAALGAIGYSIALLFIIYSAPDLALTQFAIETLIVILFVFVLYRLPKFLPFSNTPRRLRDLVISISAGLLMTLITLYITSDEMTSQLKQYFADNSVPGGKGRNIVNVILVDFRALDTMGEITVLAIAAIGVFALLKLRKEGGKK